MYYISQVCDWRNEKVFTHFEAFDNADFFDQKAPVLILAFIADILIWRTHFS